MREVNYYTIIAAIDALMIEELTHDELGIDPDDERDVRRAFATIVAPKVSRWSPYWRDTLRLALAYYIERPDVLNYKVLAKLQDFSMPEPADVAGFFRIMWEVLFPDEDLEAVSLDDVVENNDPMEGAKGCVSCIDRTKDWPPSDESKSARR